MHRLVLAFVSAVAFAPLCRAADRPNIVVIMADDMGFECLSANGWTDYETPHLDRLAKGGVRFLHAHSQPICTPSRVQLMTGISNNRNYLRFGVLDPEATTFAHLLKRAGYATCVVGKWQLDGGLEAPARFGFDEYCLWQVTRRPSRYPNPGLEVNGELKDYTGGEYGPDIVSDYLCDFIERKHDDGPFFAYYPMILPHWPFEPTPDSPDWDPEAKGSDGQKNPHYFKDMVAYTDKIVGKIDAKLAALGIREDTLVLFTGDNGTATSVTTRFEGKPYPGGKGSTRDNGTHVPMVASWPGTAPAGFVSDALIELTDWLPTVCELGGAEVPESLRLRGTSFAPLLRGDRDFAGRSHLYCWYQRDGVRDKASQHVRDRSYKLYADGRFYNVAADPKEEFALDTERLPSKAAAAYAVLKPALDGEVSLTRAADPRLARRRAELKRTTK